MNPANRPPGGGPGQLPSHLARPSQMQLLQERVQMKYGAFGTLPPQEEADRRVLADTWFRPAIEIMGGVFVASLLAFFLSHPTFDGPGAWSNTFRLDSALVVLWAPILFWAMFRQKLWKALRVYLVLAVFIEAFSEAMFREKGEGGYWDSVLWPAAVAFFGTLKEFAGIPGASLSMFFFITVGLLYRAVNGKKPLGWTAPPKFAKNALLVFLGTVLALATMGLARGGNVEWVFRQTIHLLQLPLVGLLFLYALRIPEDLAAVGTAFVTAAVVRSFLVAWVYFGICWPDITSQPGKPEWCTNHSDTVLFVTSLMILLAHALEQRKKRVTMRAIGLGAVILGAIVLNNRRLAFVSLAAATLVMYLALKPSKRKRRVTIALAILLPLLILYVQIGADIASSSPFLKPAKIIVSILEQKDNSALSRDIENTNLIYTLRQTPLLTTGFGHEYQFDPQCASCTPVDLGDAFRNYRLIAHNGVLWIWSVAGPLGFSLLWLVYPLGGTLAMRGYHAAQSPLERTAALAALAAIVVCVSQIWGDQGFNSYMTLVTFGVSFAIAARLSVRQQGVYGQAPF